MLLLLLSRFSHVRLCDPIDGSPLGSTVPGILQARKRVGCHFLLQCMKVKSESEVTQSCLTLCNSMDCSPSGSSIHGICQARILEWGTIAFSIPLATPTNLDFFLYCLKVKSESEVAQSCPIFATLWTPTRLLCPWHFPS